MNLIVSPSPKKDITKSLSGALAKELAGRLGGESHTIRIYESSQGYFHYRFNEEWIRLVKEAGRIIFPVPMWNFTIPAALKDFFDYITKQDELWAIDENNRFIGLLADRPAYIIMTSGGEYPPGSPYDFLVPYLRAMLSFLGIKDVKEFRVSGVADSEKLIADKTYFENKTRQMLQAFGL